MLCLLNYESSKIKLNENTNLMKICLQINCTNKALNNRVKAIYSKENKFPNNTSFRESIMEKSATNLTLKCKKEYCKYCCLSTNRCGNKSQCINSHNNTPFFQLVLLFITIYLGFILYLKSKQVDDLPDNNKQAEDVPKDFLKELSSLYELVSSNKM